LPHLPRAIQLLATGIARKRMALECLPFGIRQRAG